MATVSKTKKRPSNTKLSKGKKSDLLGVMIIMAVFLVSLFILVNVARAYINANQIGGGIGTAAGRTAGRFAGSYEGITEGLAEGAQEGKEEGLSAKDTEVSIGNKIQTIGNLEVLSANVVMHDVIKASNSYASLLAFYGDVTFTVDLYEAEISNEGNIYEISLPMPKATVRIDDRKSEQLATEMKHFWSGSNEDGYKAAMNSIDQLTLKAEDSITNYDYLMESAKSSAEKQVKFLIQSATGEEVVIHVSFKENNT